MKYNRQILQKKIHPQTTGFRQLNHRQHGSPGWGISSQKIINTLETTDETEVTEVSPRWVLSLISRNRPVYTND
jgi:hypothetical protein